MSIVVIWKGFAFWPSMTRVASEMKLQFMVFEMKGKERDALRWERVAKPPRRSLAATSTASHQYAIAATATSQVQVD